jgi:hypothetical protein
VHREKLVVRTRAEQVVVRNGELRPQEERLDAARSEEDECRPEVEKTDALVIRRREPTEDARSLSPDPVESLDALARGYGDGRCYFRASR